MNSWRLPFASQTPLSLPLGCDARSYQTSSPPHWFQISKRTPASPFSLADYEAASSKAGKVENEVKRLHNLIVDINSHKLKAQQDKLDKVNKELDDCSSTITKAKVAIKTADR